MTVPSWNVSVNTVLVILTLTTLPMCDVRVVMQQHTSKQYMDVMDVAGYHMIPEWTNTSIGDGYGYGSGYGYGYGYGIGYGYGYGNGYGYCYSIGDGNGNGYCSKEDIV
jgi:hypothetical protein